VRIAIGSDHAGFELKGLLIPMLKEMGHEPIDVGAYVLDEDDDYPDFAIAVANMVRKGEAERGIVICGTGIGSSIAANKVKGIRAALCHDTLTARLSREHNDANVLALGGRVIGKELAMEIVRVWLESDFLEGRHKRRLDKIREIEEVGG
jgi:ribose 5-phosphate isomerase B